MPTDFRPACFASALLLAAPTLLCAAGPRPALPSGLMVYVTGNAADKPSAIANGPALLLMGGSTDVDAAFENRVFPVLNGGDIAVLRTTGSDGYNDYLYTMVTGPLKPDSVETMIVNSTAKANTDYVEWVLDTAEFIWMAGGDQSDYLNDWSGTKVQAAVQRAWDRGAVIGGTSAGMAVLGNFIFDPDGVTASTGDEAIANPYNTGINISDRFLNAPIMDNVITDTHFRQRDRMGRAMAFMARLRQDNRTSTIRAIAVSEKTSLFVDKNGIGTVDGTDTVYAMREDASTTRTQVTAGQPLVYQNVLRTRLTSGQTINLQTWTSAVAPMILSVNGTNAAQPFAPADPYGVAVSGIGDPAVLGNE